LETYNKEVQKRIELENKLMERSSRPRITYPCPLVEPFKSTPLSQTLHKSQNITQLKILKKKRENYGYYV
jgi:hypothetical protein